ncbi:MAG: ChbG/HpnK family deacetylase [Nitrospira sp.]|nr:ChbG/HpnK family deacetylase [Nitrospira sp.]
MDKIGMARNPMDNNGGSGALILNADDWGRTCDTTDRTLECIRSKSVSSVSAMVFMEDSERAAMIAQEHAIETGLHLNFTTPFSSGNCASKLKECQQKIARTLLRHRLAKVMFYPGLIHTFEFVVEAQIEEFRRLYGTEPSRLDGHHHMHLCANVLFQGLLPADTVVRRNFSFEAAEKTYLNRLYRRMVDRTLARRHRLVDYFFSLAPLQPEDRLQRIYSLSREHVVEVEAHLVNQDEYRFLAEGGISRLAGDIRSVSV